MIETPPIDRRSLLGGAALAALGLGSTELFPAWARPVSHGLATKGGDTLSGTEILLTIGQRRFAVDGRIGHAVAINGTIPGPLLRLREGYRVKLTVDNRLNEDTSIHWHGLILPFQMDGVPGISFPGIPAGSRFTYEFPLVQSGTYWYHSHSGLQEPIGHYAPMIIDPAGPDPIVSDREHVIVLSDWSFMHPHQILSRLKQQGGYFNRQKQTLIRRLGGGDTMPDGDRDMFARMRMDPTDIADVTASAFVFLVNGHSPRENWTGLFRAGERVRLRIINAASQTLFNLRIPDLAMTVVAADGVPVRPVTVDELQIGNAETYDLIVTPEDRPYTFVAESIDRSGMAAATLAPEAGLRAPVPPLRERPILTMRDMGMDMGGGELDLSAPESGGMAGMGHAMSMRDKSGVTFPVGAGVDMIAPMPVDRSGDPGVGLDGLGHKVLNYRDLVALQPRVDQRPPTRRIDIHLTGNMERFMWSMDGEKLSENPEPYRFAKDERVRLRLINDTMMTHPMHLHGHFFEIVNGQGPLQPLKHTVRVLPGGYVDLDLTADAPGDWAFHCHLLYHMHAGMMRVVKVRPLVPEAA